MEGYIMIALVGYTGFVGSNIYASARNRIQGVFNSVNIEKAYDLEPEILIYAGLRAEKYLANNAPEKDLKLVAEAGRNIKKINPGKLVLISTIDVYKNPVGVDENSFVLSDGEFTATGRGAVNGIQPYGLNRYYLETWVRENFPDALIIRLPGLFGLNIKKNFIYDYMNVIPFMLKQDKMDELSKKNAEIKKYYELLDNGFYRCMKLSGEDKNYLKSVFKEIGFTALNFTDSRSVFQFYPLSRLWDDIQTALDNDIRLLNLATEPISAGELYKHLEGKTFKNELKATLSNYNFKTIHADKFGGKGSYICNKTEILDSIKNFVKNSSK
jgi:hypothetical protein